MIPIALSFLTGGLGRLWAFVRGLPPTTIVIALLSLSSALLWHNASGWKSRAEQCATGRAADRKSYVDAQEAATMRALAEKAQIEAKNEADRKESDAKLAIARGTADARLADYIRLRRQAAQSHPSGPNLPGTTQAPESNNGPGNDAVLVEVADLKSCTENSVRLSEAHAWFLSSLSSQESH